MKLLSLPFALGTVLLAAPLAAQTQTCSSSTSCGLQVTTTATVNAAMQLTLSSATTDLGTPSAADFTAGYKDAQGPTATVASNVPWHVSVTATSPFNAPYAKPASDVLWSAGTSYDAANGHNLGTAADLFAGAKTATASQSIFYRTKWSYLNDVPGSYGLTVTFTLAGQ
jgi:hypothetical protein